MWFWGKNIKNVIILGKFLDRRLEKEAQILPKKAWFWWNECSPKLFTPLHGFIRNIHDISDLFKLKDDSF